MLLQASVDTDDLALAHLEPMNSEICLGEVFMDMLVSLGLLLLAGIGTYWMVVRPMLKMQEALMQLQASYASMQTTVALSQQETQSLVRELKALQQSTQSLFVQTQQETSLLSRALRSTQQQGHWGELQLRRIVELAGMVEYCHFETQVIFPHVNGTRRPDLIIQLHNERSIIVDAKTPSSSYLEAMTAPDEASQKARLKAYARQVRTHILDLAKKEYWQEIQPAPALAVLFLPNEAMFRAALEHDLSLLDIATQNHVLLASPTTLIALLKTIAYGWSQENRAKNVQQIVDQSQDLQEELLALVKQWQDLGKVISKTTSEYNRVSASYTTKVLPLVQKMRDLDGTLAVKEKALEVPLLPVTIQGFPVLEERETLLDPTNVD
jgi:DNA recombination protein RmuC